MNLESLASCVAAVQTARTKSEKYQLIGDMLYANPHHLEDIIKIVCATPKDRVKSNHILTLINTTYGIFPEEYDDLWEEKELPLILADESPAVVESSLTLLEARQLKQSIVDGENVNADILFKSMSRIAATVFWGFCFGRTLINYTNIMGGVCTKTDYSRDRLMNARTIMPSHDVILKAFMGDLSDNHTIEPCFAFIGPKYSRWPYWSLPFSNTHYEIIKSQHHFVHRKNGRVFCFDRGANVSHVECDIDGEFDFVAEVDGEGTLVEWLYRDDAPDLWRSNRIERCTNSRVVESKKHLRTLVESLERYETLRLIDGDRPYFHSGAVGGFIVPRRTFDLPLLILGGKRDSEGVRMKIGALDGFEPYPIGYAFVAEDALPHSLSYMMESNVYRECDDGTVGIFHALKFDREKNILRAPYLIRLDTTLGMYDAIQIGDLMERTNDE